MPQYTYIKTDVVKKYVTLETQLTPDKYDNLGTTWQDYLDNKWVLLSPEQVAFHEEYPKASVKEVWDMQFAPPHVRTLEEAKREKISEIDAYDSSSNVNSFTVNETNEGWFTPTERSNFRNSIDAAKLLGIEEVSFYVKRMTVTVPTAMAEQMLAQVQIYADQCFMVTQGHKNNVNALTTIEEVDSYNYHTGYPQQIDFEIGNEEEE